jgi:hypothetical protein
MLPMDSANQIFGGLIGLFLFVCLITLVIYWIAFPIIVTRYLKQILQSQQKAEGHLRVLRYAYEEQTKPEPLPPPLTLDKPTMK